MGSTQDDEMIDRAAANQRAWKRRVFDGGFLEGGWNQLISVQQYQHTGSIQVVYRQYGVESSRVKSGQQREQQSKVLINILSLSLFYSTLYSIPLYGTALSGADDIIRSRLNSPLFPSLPLLFLSLSTTLLLLYYSITLLLYYSTTLLFSLLDFFCLYSLFSL